MPTTNATHRKRLARALAAELDIPYLAALDRVTAAATAGRLPKRLDEAGMAAALRILTSTAPTDAPADADTGEAVLGSVDSMTAWALAGARSPNRRIASDPRDQQVWDLSAAYEQATGNQALLYISSPGSSKDRYVFADGAAGGKVCLGREEALAHIYTLLANIPPAAAAAQGDRRPYVGEGADGARRSVQIDREEADGLDVSDPRHAELLASADRWEAQADRLTTTAPTTRPSPSPTSGAGGPVMVDGQCQHARTEYRSQDGTYCADCGEHLVSYQQLLAEDRLHLEPAYLRLLRQVWQGRVAWERHGARKPGFRFTIDNTPASDIKDIELRWLRDHGYITTPPLAEGDEWAVARTTEWGEEVLAFHGADRDRFADGLPQEQPNPGARANTVTFADIQRCPKRSLEASHYRPDGSCLCVADPTAGFSVEGTTQATVRGLLRVREAFVKAGRVEWWWHIGPHAGAHGFKTVEGIDEEDGSVILRDEEPGWMEPVTRLTLDYLDYPDRAARHLIWPHHSGVTLCDKRTGAIDATYKIAPPADTTRQPRRIKTTRTAVPLNPETDRLLGGPYTTQVTDHANPRRTVNATCDVCGRRLATGEEWWLVRAPGRNWFHDAGVACAAHSPATLPPETR